MADTQSLIAIDDALIEEIVRRVLTVADPDRIVLFGSAADDTMTRDSDIDLLIVESQRRDRRRESVAIGDAFRGMGIPFDVLVISKEWFESTKNVVGGIAYPANKYGKVIYAAA